MKFLVISDLHGNTGVLDRLEDEFRAADAVLFAGDFAECFKPETGKPALEALCRRHDTIFAVLGNCDEPSFIEELDDNDISVEKTLLFREGLAFAGSGGGSRFTGKTPFERTEEELLSDLGIVESSSDSVFQDGKWGNLIVISHNPPADTKCDAVNPGLHAGSALFRKFIEEKRPLAVVTGHIHEGRAVDKIGDTVIINPGALADGNYAVMEVTGGGGKWKVVSAELRKAGG